MQKITRFEDLIAWQKAQDLAVFIYEAFENSKDFGFKDQICRAAVSISNNVAEGFDRQSRADFVNFLRYAIGSCSEVKSMLYLAVRLNKITQQEMDTIMRLAAEESKILVGLRKSVKVEPSKEQKEEK